MPRLLAALLFLVLSVPANAASSTLPSITDVQIMDDFESFALFLSGFPREEVSVRYTVRPKHSDEIGGGPVLMVAPSDILWIQGLRAQLNTHHDRYDQYVLTFVICEKSWHERDCTGTDHGSNTLTRTITYVPQSTQREIPEGTDRIFQSGQDETHRITGEFNSSIVFTPERDMTVEALPLDPFTCTGKCVVRTYISGGNGRLHGESVQVGGHIADFDGVLDKSVWLQAGREYNIFLQIYAPDGAEILNAGLDHTLASGAGSYRFRFGSKEGYGYDEWGPIAFSLMGTVDEGGTFPPPSVRFWDIAEDHRYRFAIEYLRAKGIIDGYPDGSFVPDNTINRAEMLKLLVEAHVPDIADLQCRSPLKLFPDVDLNVWYQTYVCTGLLRGTVLGYPDGYYRPENPISFVEAAKMLSLSFNLPGPDTVQGNWYKQYVDALAARSAIPTTIRAFDQQVSRGEVAEMIYRLLVRTHGHPSRTYDDIMQVQAR